MNTVRLYHTACAYVRSSAPDDLLDVSLVQQSVHIMDFCSESQHVLVRTVAEPRAAGRQPKLDRLLDRATSPKRPYDLFVVSNESRLSRDPAKISRIKSRLAAAGVTLVVLEALPRIVPMQVEAF